MSSRIQRKSRSIARVDSISTVDDDTDLGYSIDDEEEVVPNRKRRRDEPEMPPPGKPAGARETLKECKIISVKLDQFIADATTHGDYKDMRELILKIKDDIMTGGTKVDVTDSSVPPSDLKRLRKELAAANERTTLAKTKAEKLTYELKTLEGDVSDATKKLEQLQADLGVCDSILVVYQSLTSLNIKNEIVGGGSPVFSCVFQPSWSATTRFDFVLRPIKNHQRIVGWKFKPSIDSAKGLACSDEFSDKFLKEVDIPEESLLGFFHTMLDRSVPPRA